MMNRSGLRAGATVGLVLVVGVASYIAVSFGLPGSTGTPATTARTPALAGAPIGPGVYHQEFRTTTARPIPGDRRHWGIAPAGTEAVSDAWTLTGREGVVVKRVVSTRSPNGTLISRSLQARGWLNTYFVGPDRVLTEPAPGPINPAQLVNPQTLISWARHHGHHAVRSLGTVKLNGERLTALVLHVFQPAIGSRVPFYPPFYENALMYFVPGTRLLRAIDFGLLPPESCRHVSPRSKATCHRYASRSRPGERTVWTLSHKVPVSSVPKGVFRLDAPRSAKWQNLEGEDGGLF
jgi:hypothetical protein